MKNFENYFVKVEQEDNYQILCTTCNFCIPLHGRSLKIRHNHIFIFTKGSGSLRYWDASENQPYCKRSRQVTLLHFFICWILIISNGLSNVVEVSIIQRFKFVPRLFWKKKKKSFFCFSVCWYFMLILWNLLQKPNAEM